MSHPEVNWVCVQCGTLNDGKRSRCYHCGWRYAALCAAILKASLEKNGKGEWDDY